MSKWKTWVVLVVIFLAGGVTGSMLTLGLAPVLMPHHPPGMQQIKKFWLLHLTQRLDLTPEQQAKIEPILTEAGNQLQTLHREEADRAAQIIGQISQKISTILTPEQQVKLQEMEKEMDHDRDRMFPGHHGPWDGPPRGPGGGDPHPVPGPEDAPPPPPAPDGPPPKP